jgi:hypothetical protein
MQGFPILHDKDGTTLSTDPTLPQAQQRPKLLPPNVSAAMGGDSQAVQDILAVTGILPSPPDATWYSPTQAAQNAVAFDLQEPRAHTSQVWTVTYEGAFAKGAAGRLQCADQNKTPITCELGANPSHFQLFDSSAGFCGMGIQGNDLAQSTGMSQGDVIEVTSDFPDPNDSYWTSVSGTCGRQTCESAYGTIDNLIGTYSDSGAAIGRDFIVDRAFQDHLELAPSPERDSGTLRVPIACCFPYPVSYSARGGKQWILAGSVNGFAHHEIPDPSLSDPSTGACVLSCDPTLALRNGRALALSPPADEMLAGAIPAYDGDPRTFRNSALRFVVWNPQVSDCSTGSGVAGTVGAPQACVRRDMYFLFQESGGFDPLVISLSAATLILPESISFVPGLEQLAIPDPVSQGLMLFDLNALRIIQTIF